VDREIIVNNQQSGMIRCIRMIHAFASVAWKENSSGSVAPLLARTRI